MGASSSSSLSPVPAAEAALLHARAAAETTRAAADAAAAKERAAAETTRAAAETTRAAADAKAVAAAAAAAAMREYAALLPLAICLAVAGALAVDFARCESRTLIRRRMLRTLRACRLPSSVPTARAPLLPLPQAPLVLGPLPTMLLGPTGCGKSTLLAELARAAVASPTPAPAVLVRLRLPSRERGDASAGVGVVTGAGAGTGAGAKSAKELMDSAAEQIYAQIGYPPRRSLVGSFLARGFTLLGHRSQAEIAEPDSGPRLIGALRMLFSVCAELRSERAAAGVSALDAAPVLLFDEMQDLIKDARLKAAGGSDVFDALAALIVSYSVDRLDVRTVVAGSSAELDFAFSETVARGNRWHYHDLADPAPGVVVAALVARGYAESDARAMTALCGTRLRLLARPLALGAAAAGAAAFLDETAAAGRASFAKIFGRLDASSATELVRVLDAVVACGAGDVQDSRPTKKSLPAAARAMDMAPILYVDRSNRLSFQSALHATAWARVRGAYAARAGDRIMA